MNPCLYCLTDCPNTYDVCSSATCHPLTLSHHLHALSVRPSHTHTHTRVACAANRPRPTQLITPLRYAALSIVLFCIQTKRETPNRLHIRAAAAASAESGSARGRDVNDVLGSAYNFHFEFSLSVAHRSRLPTASHERSQSVLIPLRCPIDVCV